MIRKVVDRLPEMDTEAKFMDARKLKPADIVEAVRSDIMAGILKPGAALIQDTLARRYGVSRIPIREALRRVEAEGLIDVVYGGGTFVHVPDTSEIAEVFEIRLQLEPHVLRLSMPRLGPRDFEAAETAIGLLREEGGGLSIGEIDRRFHDAIYAGADRPLHMETIRTLQARLAGLLATAMTPASVAVLEEDMKAILDVIRKGDEKEASGRLVRQLIRTRENLISASEPVDEVRYA
ncbi:GntR family transcriptional regulator [Rhodobium gokarnense]|uniref:GntR family transcriptional regulator n=1 Tax=Rhodobium gokarnense TaxID=364296 RepID=UPI002224DB3F|nr:GntR family transcriptional regulator [Rhodobium gokarnense]